jgi:phosphatidylglycerol:prolipoprotein diacylglycerol transferase
LFGVCYALARTVSELYREPDPQSEALAYGWTMGMALSAPLVLIGLWLILASFKKAKTA